MLALMFRDAGARDELNLAGQCRLNGPRAHRKQKEFPHPRRISATGRAPS